MVLLSMVLQTHIFSYISRPRVLMMQSLLLSCLLLSFLLFSPPVVAADLDKGIRAYDAGNYAAAHAEFRPLAKRGDVDAQAYLGTMYSLGESVQQDYTEALKWYHKAAAQEDALAQSFLSAMYAKGQGVPRDYVRAHMWCKLARAQETKITDDLTKTLADDLIKALDDMIKVLETHMSQQQITTAQAMASQCVKQDYKNCDKL